MTEWVNDEWVNVLEPNFWEPPALGGTNVAKCSARCHCLTYLEVSSDFTIKKKILRNKVRNKPIRLLLLELIILCLTL